MFLRQTFAIYSLVACALFLGHTQSAKAQQAISTENFANSLFQVSELIKSKASKAEQVSVLCPVIRNNFDMTYILAELYNWMKYKNPNTDIDQLSAAEREKLFIGYFAVNLLDKLEPLFDALENNKFEFTLIEKRAPQSKELQEYIHHDHEIVFKFRNSASAKAFISFMTPGSRPLIRTATLDHMYGKHTLTSVTAKTLRGKNVDFLVEKISSSTNGQLRACP